MIYGCALNEKFAVVHIRAVNKEDRNRMRGSKYVQSRLGDTFKMVKEDLDTQKKVLFSGTSCQVAGLKRYLGKEYDNLLCVDIVCHGVPSKKVWDAYLHWQEQKNHSKVAWVDFRNKKDFGWRDHVETVWFENGKSTNCRVFKNLFYGHTILRPSCYVCPYKSVIHPGDITIADYWGLKESNPDLYHVEGTSMILTNTNKGGELLKKMKNVCLNETSINTILENKQPHLYRPLLKKEEQVKQFWMEYQKYGYEFLANKYADCNKKALLKRRIKNNIIYKRIRGYK